MFLRRELCLVLKSFFRYLAQRIGSGGVGEKKGLRKLTYPGIPNCV
jgi:hypothetical protein